MDDSDDDPSISTQGVTPLHHKSKHQEDSAQSCAAHDGSECDQDGP
jgi:hypothetical protein